MTVALNIHPIANGFRKTLFRVPTEKWGGTKKT